MENATKALLMAAGVFITIIVISIGTVLYHTFASQTKGYTKVIENSEISKFNSSFITYLGKKNISAQEVVSVVNLAREKQYPVTVDVYVGEVVQTIGSNPEDFLKNNSDKIFCCLYKNSVNPLYNSDGRITKLVFSDSENIFKSE